MSDAEVVIRRATRREIPEVEELSVAAYAKYRSEVPASVFEGYVADLRRLSDSWQEAEVLVAEVRGPFGNDVDLCTSGLLLYRVRSDVASAEGPVRVVDTHPRTTRCQDRSVNPRLADAPLAEGESHTVPDGGGVRFEVDRRLPSGALEVTVARGARA